MCLLYMNYIGFQAEAHVQTVSPTHANYVWKNNHSQTLNSFD